MSENVENIENEHRCEGIKEELLVCSQCNSQFDEEDHVPKLLPCLHTFCSTCLEKLVQTDILSCPSCCDDFELTNKSLETFVTDYTKIDLLHFFNAFHQQSDISCSNCEEGQAKPGEYRCQVCEIFLCSTCRLNHSKIRKWKSHQILTISEIKDPSDFSYDVLCPVHAHKTLEEYCAICKEPVCSKCWMDDHCDPQKHSKEDITVVFQKERDALLKKADTINEKGDEITQMQENTVEVEAVSRQTIKAEFEITSFFNRCIRHLENRKKYLLEKLNTVSEKNLDTARKQNVHFNSQKQQISHATSFLEQSCLSQNPAAFLNIAPIIEKRFDKLTDEDINVETKVTGDIVFFNRNKDIFEQMLKTQGDILSTDAYPSTSSISVPETIQKNEATVFQATLNDYHANSVEGPVYVSAVLKEHSTGQRAKLDFTESGEGLYEASCTIKNLGTYDFQLMVNGTSFGDSITTECIEPETGSAELTEDKYEEVNEFFCNGEAYPETDDESGSSDAYLEDEDDIGSDFVDNEESDTVIVRGYSESTTEEEIRTYFNENSSDVEVEDVQMNKDEGLCVVTFSSTVSSEMCQTKHICKGSTLKVELKVNDQIAIPSPLRITDQDWNQMNFRSKMEFHNKMKFLLNSSASREVLDIQMSRLDAEIHWSSADEKSLTINCLLTHKTRHYKMKATRWSRCVERELLKCLDTLRVEEQKIKPEEWDVLERRTQRIHINDMKRVLICCDKPNLCFVIVGYTIPLGEVSIELQLITSEVNVQERLENFEIQLLTNGKVLQDINKIYKGIKIVPNGRSGVVEFHGTAGIVAEAKEKMADALSKVGSVPMHGFSFEKIQFLQTPTVQVELEKLLHDHGIVGAWKVTDNNTLVVYSLSDTSAKKAADVVTDSVVEVTVDMNPKSDMKQWDEELKDIKKKKGGNVQVQTGSNKVVIFAIPKENAKAIEEHVKIFQKYPDRKIRGTTHFSTKTGQTISTICGDITDLDNDVIVCSSSRTLSLTAGVGQTLVTKGGMKIHEECQEFLKSKPYHSLDEDEVFCSKAGNLKCQMVAHVGGSQWEHKPEKAKPSLIKVVQRSLELTSQKRFKSFAIPALYTGHSGYPVKEVTEWIVEAVHIFLNQMGQQTSIRNIYLCDIKKTTADSFREALKSYYSLVYERE